eukprot:TRINITY_DN5010_c0_g1_i1.p1 TRINITY_DN5010_c0_g1~~TRINITY_DN5010_c0_g1_i1.p1  ORF type:complete len:839 (+),score=296.05 TRINITY_DN5010_c0_g1_i1:94-2610(+)
MASGPFEDLFICINSNTTFENSNLSDLIEQNGGTPTKVCNKNVDYLVAVKDNDSAEIRQAKKYKLPIVTEQWILDSIKSGKIKAASNYPVEEEEEADGDEDKDESESDEEVMQWSWQSDNGWVAYDEDATKKFEAAFQKKQKTVKVDDERFIDLKNMYQRRKDDPSKIRPVERKAVKKSSTKAVKTAPKPAVVSSATSSSASPPAKTKAVKSDDEVKESKQEETSKGPSDYFDGLIFYFMKDPPGLQSLAEQIEDAGGNVRSRFDTKVTHVVTDEELDSSQLDEITSKMKIVTAAFVKDSIKKGKKMSESDYAQFAGTAGKKRKKSTSDSEEETGIVWQWKDDAEWKDYDSATSKKIEQAYQAKESEVKVDNARFVDFGAMVQRRYDDKSKRREVKRVVAKKGQHTNKKQKVVKKGRSVVDPLSGKSNDFHVLEEGKVIWDAMLNQTDVGKNNNKFYVIQLLEHDHKKQYQVWNRWGRVGAGGQNVLDACPSLEAAKKKFEKKFYDKTGNKWTGDFSQFTKQPGKYMVVEIDYASEDEEEKKKAETKQLAKSAPKTIKIPDSQLEQAVADLIELICDVKKMRDTLVEMEIDVKKMPLGKLSKKQIMKGFEILKEIETILNGGQYSRPKLVDCANRFYTLIPHNYGMKVPPLLDNKKMVQAKLEMLEALTDMEIAQKILNTGKDLDENPVDTQYKALNTEIVTLSHSDTEFKIIQKYVKNTHAPTHTDYTLEVLDVFKIARKGEDELFKPWAKSPNRQLLWHGSRVTNWVGILSQGLRIAPPEAPVTGYMFGKGGLLDFFFCGETFSLLCGLEFKVRQLLPHEQVQPDRNVALVRSCAG